MGFITGAKALQDAADRASGGDDRRKVPWFKIKDKESARIKFLQEFDPDSEGYDEKFGLCGLLVEHSSPEDFKRKALCTMEDDGECVGCEEYAKGNDKWRPKMRFYANILVIPDRGDPEVQIISSGIGKGSVYPALLSFFNENGPITPHTFRITRSGADFNNTSYTLTAQFKPTEVDLSNVEVYDIEKEVGLHIPYERQRNFYLLNQEKEVADDEGLTGGTFNEDEWV